jgi:predicted acetyltransferase
MSEPALPTEVRSIRDGEQEQFLALMCECFALDFDSARSVFYDDPYYDLTHKRVLVDADTGTFLSCLTLVPSAIRITGGALVSVAGIAGVCTAPNSRGKGHARSLIRETLETIPKEFGYSAAALVTTRPQIYHSVGFDDCSEVIHWSVNRQALPAFHEADSATEVKPQQLTELLPQLRTLYQSSQSSQPGIFLRSDRRWKTILRTSPDTVTVIWRNKRRIEGCLTYRVYQTSDAETITVLDLFASTAAGRRGLIGYLASLKSAYLITGESRPSDLRRLGIQDMPEFTSFKRPGVMMAIADFETCLSAAASTGLMTPVIRRSTSGLTIRLENAISQKDRKPVRLFSVSTERLGVAIGLAPADEMTGDWISADMGAMVQLFFGNKSASALHTMDRLRVSSPSALAIADSLFPSFNTYLGQQDGF